jgi:hypothetical protein
MFKLQDRLFPTDHHHSDFVDAMAYAIATREAELRDHYVLLYVKKCPKWLPQLFYRWILGKVLVLAEFRRTRTSNIY